MDCEIDVHLLSPLNLFFLVCQSYFCVPLQQTSMANGRVEIHDPLDNHDDLNGPSSDADSLQNTLEYRLLMAYTKKRQRLRQKRIQLSFKDEGPLPDQSQEETTPTKTKKKMKWKMMSTILVCVKPQTAKRPKESEAENIIFEEGFRSGKEANVLI